MKRVQNRKQVILSPPDSPEATAVPNSLDEQTPVEGQGGDSPRGSIQMRDLPILLEEGRVEASSSGKGHDAPFPIGPEGHEKALLGRSQSDKARVGASSSGNKGQGGTSSSPRNEDLSHVVAFMRGPEGPGEAFVSWLLSTRREGEAGASLSGNERQGGTASNRNEDLSHEAGEAILSWFRSEREGEAGASSSGKEEGKSGAIGLTAEEGQGGASPRGSSPMRNAPTMVEEGRVAASLSTKEGLGGASLSGKEGHGGASQGGDFYHMTLRPSSRLQTAQSRAKQGQGGASLRGRSHMTLRRNRLPEDVRGGASSSGKEGLGAVRVGNEDRGGAALSGSDYVRNADRLLKERPDGASSSRKEGQRGAPPRRTEGEGGSPRSGSQTVHSGDSSIRKEEHVPAALFSAGEERQFGAPSKGFEEMQGQDGASTSGKGEQGGASLSEKVEQGGASSSEKQGHVGVSKSGKEVQGQEINRSYVPQVPEGAERPASSPPELNINNRVVSESKNGLGEKKGQSGASSSGPKGRQGGASWTGEKSQVTGAFTSGSKEVQGPESADQNAASSSPRLNANYRARASNETRIKKINYDMGTWSLENGQAMGYFNVTRSDEKDVPMDNHFLREKYPQMLIDFYEQKLLKKGPI